MKTIQEVESFLYRTHARNVQHVKKDMTLERMWPLLALADNPQDKLRVIHVAGTSGKTSTCYFTAEILANAGVKVGLTVSPHISSITERLQIANQPLSEEKFVELFEKFIRLFPAKNVGATYFELMIVFVLWAFVELEVEVVVLETGLGGMHDGTNVCQRADKMCVITEIGYDHQDILGDTLEEIATQKAGIIHQGNSVYMYKKEQSVQSVFDERVRVVGASRHLVEPPYIDTNDKVSLFQQRNWHLAFEAASAYMFNDHKKVLDRYALYETTKKQVPGRLQKIRIKGIDFYLDGAHNVQKAEALVESVLALLGDTKIPVILAVKKGKDSAGFLQVLQPITAYLLCTEYEARQDLPVSSVPALELADQARALGMQVEVVEKIDEAISLISKRNEPVVLVTGSLYGLGQATRAILSIDA